MIVPIIATRVLQNVPSACEQPLVGLAGIRGGDRAELTPHHQCQVTETSAHTCSQIWTGADNRYYFFIRGFSYYSRLLCYSAKAGKEIQGIIRCLLRLSAITDCGLQNNRNILEHFTITLGLDFASDVNT